MTAMLAQQTNKMTTCAKCRKSFEEINLTWVQVKGKIILYCDDCNRKSKKSG
jgi:hypothetical protein